MRNRAGFSITIGSEIAARLLGEAAAMPAREVCGLLLGAEDRVDAAVAAANVAADPARTFEIDPTALIAAHRAARAGGPGVIGCYHSHPSGDATPSETDRAAAEPGALWVIVAGGRARGWRRGEREFAEVVLRHSSY